LDTTATAYPDGDHTVAMRATDSFGLITTSPQIVIKVDNTPPTTIAVTVIAVSPYTNPFWVVQSTANDNLSGVISVTRLFDMAIFAVGTNGSWNFAYSSPNQNRYTSDIYRVADLAGNCSNYNYLGTLLMANTCP
jgi:hypothetical protein